MRTGWLLDSVALIDWYCGRTGVVGYVTSILQGESSGAFSTISEVELWQGIRPGEEERHEAMLLRLHRIPVDQAIARRAGELRRELGLDKLSLPDAVIAATAAVTGQTLLTRNTQDFSALVDRFDIEFYPKN